MPTITGKSAARRFGGPMAECPICGDDFEIHDWVSVSTDNVILDCDRNEDGPAQDASKHWYTR